MKICNACGELKSLEDFTPCKQNKVDGRRGQCKECINIKVRERKAPKLAAKKLERDTEFLLHKEQALNKSSKICTICGQEKQMADFTNNANSIDGKHSSCRMCKNEKAAIFRFNNRDELNRKKKIYVSNNKEAKAAADKRYREANKDKLAIKMKLRHLLNKERYKENRQQALKNRSQEEIELAKQKKRIRVQNASDDAKLRKKEYDKKYFSSEAGKLTTIKSIHKRRAQKIATDDNTITSQSLENLKVVQEYKCAYCKCELDFSAKGKVHLDHVYPLSKGGVHSISNVVWSCATCNLKKSDTIINNQETYNLITDNELL